MQAHIISLSLDPIDLMRINDDQSIFLFNKDPVGLVIRGRGDPTCQTALESLAFITSNTRAGACDSLSDTILAERFQQIIESLGLESLNGKFVESGTKTNMGIRSGPRVRTTSRPLMFGIWTSRNDHVHLKLLKGSQRRSAVTAFSDHLKVWLLFEQSPQAMESHGFVIDDQHAQFHESANRFGVGVMKDIGSRMRTEGRHR
jgi:hypothetical protein